MSSGKPSKLFGDQILQNLFDGHDWSGDAFIFDPSDVSSTVSQTLLQHDATPFIDDTPDSFFTFAHDHINDSIGPALPDDSAVVDSAELSDAGATQTTGLSGSTGLSHAIEAVEDAAGHGNGLEILLSLSGQFSDGVSHDLQPPESAPFHNAMPSWSETALTHDPDAHQIWQTTDSAWHAPADAAGSTESSAHIGQTETVLVGFEASPNGTMNGTVQTATTNTTGSTTVHYGTSGLQFNITYDASVNSAPVGFVSTIASVIQWFQSHFNDPVTVNIDVGYGEINGQSIGGGALGESLTYLSSFSYNSLRNALTADAKTADDAAAVGTLPTTSPAPNGGTYWISTAEQKALGLLGASSSLDGFVGFSSANNIFDFNESDGITAGHYDFFAVVAHEFSEVMGRQLEDGGKIGHTTNSFEPLDLFHYSSNGVRDFSGTTAGYFSIDKGATNLDSFNTSRSGDFGDWAASAGQDAFLAFSNSGVVNALTTTDIRVMDVLGWNHFA